MDSTFVRKDFYVTPPAKDSTPEEWATWLKQDQAKAKAAKAAFTRSLKAQEMPAHLNGTATRKINGVWRSTTAIGFTGSVEDGTGQAEAIIEPNQERDIARSKIVPLPRTKSTKRTGQVNRKATIIANKLRNSHFAELRRKGKI